MKSIRTEFNRAWIEFKKDLSWNKFKGLLSGVLPLSAWMYVYLQWMKLVNPLLDEFTKHIKQVNIISQHDAVLASCVFIGFTAPIFLAFPIMQLGFWLGRVTRFYTDNKTIYLQFDDVSYYLRDMTQDERNKIQEILASYKSKLQLRKEGRANWSWFRRNFT